MTTTTWNKRTPGRYSRTMGDDHYALVNKRGREWHAEVRNNSHGDIVRFAGIWTTKHEALATASDIGE